MDKKIIIELIVILVCIALLLYKGKKKELTALAGTLLAHLVEEAEEYLGSGQGQEKLERVLASYKEFSQKLHPISRLLLRLFLSEDKIKDIIEGLLPYINNKFNLKRLKEERSVKSLVGRVVDDLLGKAVRTEYEGNRNLISNSQIINLGEEIKLKEEKGYVEAFLRAKSDLKDSHEVEGGLSAGIKF